MAKFNPKIYLKDSDKVRLADYRARIVRETNPREPCDNEDLVFEKVENKEDIPKDALYSWYFAPMNVWFFTTADRCKQMVSEDPSYWTKEKLEEFARIEGQLYRNWWNGEVYGYWDIEMIDKHTNKYVVTEEWIKHKSLKAAFKDNVSETVADYTENDFKGVG